MNHGLRTTRFLVVAMCLQAVAANADVVLGGSRSAGMAGAGLALPGYGGLSGQVNPAALPGYPNNRLSLGSIGLHVSGLDFGDLRDRMKGGSGNDKNDLGKFAREFGGGNTEFGANYDLGIPVGPVTIGFSAQARVRSIPNASLRADVARNDGTYGAGSQLDAYGFGYHSLDIGYSKALPKSPTGDFAVGARARFMRGYFAHHIANSGTIAAGGDGAPAPEMNGDNVISHNGLALDLGLQGVVGAEKNVFVGAVIENAIRPNLGFNATEPADMAPGRSSVDPFRRRLNLGVGTMTKTGTTVAFDIADTFGGRSREARFGVNQVLGKGFEARLGYSSATKFTLGFTVLGMNIAFSRDTPFTVSKSFPF
ncbi:MAG: hypothetical protein KIS66_00630 [Fimbriimonadaceae bacterium]|nr:hypothetical protein [Fimbriimonadaceae bacterium]